MWFRKRDRDWRQALREFIYLDEVSVTSLLAARDGDIPESVTDTLSRSTEAESSYSVSGPVKGLKLGSESRNKVTDTTAQEVVRRAVIQSTFRRLHTGNGGKHRPFGDRSRRDAKFDAEFATVEALKKKSKKLEKAGALKRLDSMSRGDLVEVEVTLRPARTFLAAHALESVSRMMAGRPQIFGDVSFQIKQASPMADVLTELMVGLVPIRAASTNIALVSIDEHKFLVDTRVLAPGSEVASSVERIEFVAQTEVASYWKDLRRVLYSGNDYTIYARLTSPEMRPSWKALKLNELLHDMSKEMGDAVAALEKIVNDMFDKAAGAGEPVIDLRVMMHRFADALPGAIPSEEQTAVDDAITAAMSQFSSASGLADVRAAFDIVVAAHERAVGREVDRLEIARSRAEVIKAAETDAVAATFQARSASAPAVPQFEVEVVAIYW